MQPFGAGLEDTFATLSPLRGGKCLASCVICRDGGLGESNSCWPAEKLPFVAVTSVVSEIGKFELLEAMMVACSCRSSQSSLCYDCLQTYVWVKPSIPRCLLRLRETKSIDNDLPEVLIWVRAASYATMNYVCLVSGNKITVLNDLSCKKETWMGPWTAQPGDVLRFLAVPEHSPPAASTSMHSDNGSWEFQIIIHQHSSDAIGRPLTAALADAVYGGDNVECKRDLSTLDNLPLESLDKSTVVHGIDDSTFFCSGEDSSIQVQESQAPCPPVVQEECHEVVDRTFPILSSMTARSDTGIPAAEKVAATTYDHAALSSVLSAPVPLPSSTTPQDVLVGSDSAQLKPTPKPAGQFALYFVAKGSDMHKKTHIAGLRRLAEQRGAMVMNGFDKDMPSTWPTHFVVSQNISVVESISDVLGFCDKDEMSHFLVDHDIVCATRNWVSSSSAPLQEPTMMQQILGLRECLSSKQQKRANEASDLLSPPMPHTKQRQNEKDRAIIWNKDLSNLFLKLAKLHQECPLYVNDDWKAYMFHLLSGRLRHLGFEVKNEGAVLKRLKQIHGFGDSSMQIIEEFLQTGTSSRIHEFQTNKQRAAMKVMMNIWGVGRVRASELVNAGFMRIGSVRQAVSSGTLRLERNQFIGLECYEDILEEMTREEAEMIAEIVFSTIRTRFPSAELSIMGSYRRGKLTCGDVDILIVHPTFLKEVSPKILGLIVDELRTKGHIAYHLTFISGMKHELFETLPAKDARKLTHFGSYGRTHDKEDKGSSSSWMGVFNSPLIPGKRRRVDIKFYPYAERIFASLYFTGNGHFNRSMRLWATRKFNYKLNDHGLYDNSTDSAVLVDPRSELEVFEFLSLKWKEPSERDCFDAVESHTGEKSCQLEMNRREVSHEDEKHVWID